MSADAMIQEMGVQRMLMGDRAAQLASLLADANAKIEELTKRIAELEKKPDA